MSTDDSKKYAVIQCYNCGFIIGREVIGRAWNYEGKYKTVRCSVCHQKIELAKAKIFYRSNDPEEISELVKKVKWDVATSQ